MRWASLHDEEGEGDGPTIWNFRHRVIERRPQHLHGRSFSQLAGLDRSSMAPYYPKYSRQSKTSPRELRREKRLENSLLRRLVHPCAPVQHFQRYVTARRQISRKERRCGCRIKYHDPRAKCDPATFTAEGDRTAETTNASGLTGPTVRMDRGQTTLPKSLTLGVGTGEEQLITLIHNHLLGA